MKNTTMLFCLTLTALIYQCAFGQIPPHSWSATVNVVGEDGNPVVGADVTITYDLHPLSRETGKGKTWDQIEGPTDANGEFSASHTDNSFGLGVIVEKAGYYTTRTGHQFYSNEQRQNPSFTLLLKKVGTPIAMYAKKEEIKMPTENEPVGFDLMAGDWVTPYGTGKTTDLLFTVHRSITNSQKFDADLELTFPNADDGAAILSPSGNTNGFSQLATPHSAPEGGYHSTLKWSYHDFTETSEPASGYLFRVRTVLDESGNVKSALYGKIQGDIRFLVGSKAPQAAIAFNYYLNPTPNDKNVEFDPKQNLLGGLQLSEQVTAP
jgi:hypothetical protein